MDVGTRVKPVDTFDFDRFSGPSGLNDTGIVTGIYEEADGGVYVEWEGSGMTTDHSTKESEDGAFTYFGVVPVTAN